MAEWARGDCQAVIDAATSVASPNGPPAIIRSAETLSEKDHRQEDIDTSVKITLRRIARLPSPLVIKIGWTG